MKDIQKTQTALEIEVAEIAVELQWLEIEKQKVMELYSKNYTPYQIRTLTGLEIEAVWKIIQSKP